jgi:hypothetical protein
MNASLLLGLLLGAVVTLVIVGVGAGLALPRLMLHERPSPLGFDAGGVVARVMGGPVAALRAEHYADSLRELIAVLQEKPDFDAGHAKTATLAIFKHLGMRHSITEEFYRAFSMAVNV